MTLGEILERLEREREGAARYNATAPVAAVLASVIEDLRPLAQGPKKPARAEGMMTAKEIAQEFEVGRNWPYDHQKELGGVKLGGALRFPRARVTQYLRRRS